MSSSSLATLVPPAQTRRGQCESLPPPRRDSGPPTMRERDQDRALFRAREPVRQPVGRVAGRGALLLAVQNASHVLACNNECLSADNPGLTATEREPRQQRTDDTLPLAHKPHTTYA